MKFFHHISARILEYCIIILVFALPPIFVLPQEKTAASVSLSVVLFYACTAVFLYLRTVQSLKAETVSACLLRKEIFAFVCKILVCYCALIISALFWNYIAEISGGSELSSLVFPQSFGKRLLFFASTIIFACYEEILFRFFLPVTARGLIRSIALNAGKTKPPVSALIIAELIPIVLFSLAHRYLGFYAVCNALCAALILRFALYKKLHIAALCAVHCIYNITIFVMLTRI